MSMVGILSVLLLLLSVSAMRVQPPLALSESSFHNATGVSVETFLQNGSAIHTPWILLFKVPDCKHCTHAEMFFQSLLIEYSKRLHFEKATVGEILETDLSFATIDCQESPLLCTKFNVQQYPTFYVVEGNGEVCNYEGDRMPGSMMAFLEQRRRGEGSLQCRPLGRISFWTKILGYLDPIVDLLNYNTGLFILAFIIGPFLFGFVFSRTKKQKVEQAEAIQQKND